jgi:hypothetical protein
MFSLFSVTASLKSRRRVSYIDKQFSLASNTNTQNGRIQQTRNNVNDSKRFEH